MPDNEIQEWQAIFPDLDADYVYETGNRDLTYNCVTWAMGIDDEWIDIDDINQTVSDFEARGFVRTKKNAGEATVHLIGQSEKGHLSHAIVKYRGRRLATMPDDLWESKMTEGQRFTHNKDGLCGDHWGQILASLKKKEVEASPEIKPKKPIRDKTAKKKKGKRGK